MANFNIQIKFLADVLLAYLAKNTPVGMDDVFFDVSLLEATSEFLPLTALRTAFGHLNALGLVDTYSIESDPENIPIFLFEMMIKGHLKEAYHFNEKARHHFGGFQEGYMKRIDIFIESRIGKIGYTKTIGPDGVLVKGKLELDSEAVAPENTEDILPMEPDSLLIGHIQDTAVPLADPDNRDNHPTQEAVVQMASPSNIDAWEPLPIDRTTDSYQPMVESLEAAKEEIRKSNGYSETYPEERDQIVGNLELGIKWLKEEATIQWIKIEAFLISPLRIAGQRLQKSANELAIKEAIKWVFVHFKDLIN